MATLNINDNTSDFAKRRGLPYEKLDRDKQIVGSHLLLLQIVVGQIWHSIRPVGFVFCLMGIVQ
jgi:hypothetical protein